MVVNGYSPYYEGIGLTLYSDYQLQEMQKDPHYQKYYIPPIPITDEDLRDAPELKQLIKSALSKEHPLNKGGKVPITFEELDNFQQQYAEILSEKYSREPADFFTTDDRHMPEKYLAIDTTVHLREFEGNNFEYEGIQYGIQPDTFYVPFVEDESFLHLEVYQTNGPLREKDHTWSDLTEAKIHLKPKIVAAIADIGQHQENIRVSTSGLSPSTMTKYENWQDSVLEGNSMFEYEGKIFSVGFWIA